MTIKLRNENNKEKDKGFKHQFVRKITGTFGLTIIFTALSFITSILLARLLDTKGYGIYTYTATWVSVFTVISGLGFRNILVREIAIYKAKSESSLILGLVSWSNKLVLIVSVLTAIIVGLIIWLFVFDSDKQLGTAFWLTLLILPFYTLNGLRQGAMQGLNYLVIGQIPEKTIQPVLFLLILIIWIVFFKDNINVSGVIIIKLLTTIIAFVVGSIMLAKTINTFIKKSKRSKTNQAYLYASWLRSIPPFLLIGCTHLINNRTDTLMLGYFQGTEAVGVYFVASRAAELVSFILIAVNMSIAPNIAKLYSESNLEQLQKLITKSSCLTFGASLIIGGSLIIFGKWFLLMFGVNFIRSYTCLVILCAAQIFNSFIGSVGIFLDMTGNEKISAIGIGISSICNFLLNLLFISKWGIEGAASATAISIFIWNFYLAIYVKRILGIMPTPISNFYGSRFL